MATADAELEKRSDMKCDVATARIVYRTVGGGEVSALADRVRLAGVLDAAPWRTFRWYEGQRHYSGQYWSATERSLVIYESRMELAALLLADFDTAVQRIVAQPFCMEAVISGKVHRRIPDFLLATDDGPVVVDVIRSERLAHTGVQLACSWTQQVLESVGWSYRIVSEQPPQPLNNVRFLAGYRRDWLIDAEALAELRPRATKLAGLRIDEVERQIDAIPHSLVRSALLHLLWRQEFIVDLTRPLSPSTVLEPAR
jgi:hypothetical protein